MTMLQEGDSVQLDFDGVCARVAKNGFNDFGEPIVGVAAFTQECARRGIKVYIWSARFDNPFRHKEVGYGTKCLQSVEAIRKYLDKHGFYYTDFYIHEKAWGAAEHQSEFLIDDKVIEFRDSKYLSERIFGGQLELKADEFHRKNRGLNTDELLREFILNSLYNNNDKEYILRRILEMRVSKA